MRLSLRLPVLAVALLLAALLYATLAASAAEASGGPCRAANATPSKLSKQQASKAILCLINNERRSQGLRKLDNHGAQTKAARRHSRLMIRSTCFSHQCPGEAELVSRLERADYLPCGGCYWGVGENLAYGERAYGSPKRIMQAWMNSSAHRANILNGNYEHVGIGIAWGTPERGADRSSATYTTDFGYRR